jgi:hypothetical protein
VAWDEPSGKSELTERWVWPDWAAALVLFSATAAIVLWQNSRLAVLWDLSYVLENSYRISLGQLPYRDFPFPYAPGTFLVQALLIRLTGRAFLHHVLYCATVGGAGTLLTWRILLQLLRNTLESFRLIAFFLAAPLTGLGIYSVFPHPFYDPDCTFVILCCVLLLLRLGQKDFAPLQAFFTGAIFVIPLFVKQNTGLAFLAIAAPAAAILVVARALRHERVTGHASFLLGMAVGLGTSLLLLHCTVGLRNYARWTLAFAASRRLPSLAELFAPYHNPLLLVWFAAFGTGVYLLRRAHAYNRALKILPVVLMAAPFLWSVLYLFLDTDTSERAERLLALWPFLLAVSLAFALWKLRRGASVSNLLPLVLIATVQGAFLSQQLWGSTYAIWPLLMLLLAGILPDLSTIGGAEKSREIEWLAGLSALCLLIAGSFYVASHERLDYADVSTGEIERSSLPPLKGLAIRGKWISQFEELVRFSEREIPRDQGLLMIPGEDLFYYTTARRPQFPVLMFDHTVNPYSPEQIAELARRQNVCWLVVKNDLQLNSEPVEDKGRLLESLSHEFAPFQSLENYEIYRRTAGGSCG